MKLKDLLEVMDIERQSYPSPWSLYLFIAEIKDNRFAHYLVMRQKDRIIAYGGMWIFAQESHITNLAVHPSCRYEGYGKTLLEALIEEAGKRGLNKITLEVRVSNLAARKLYQGRGFKVDRVRRNYYGNEDALLLYLYLEEVQD
ncbi:MAG: ribosomal-protein-alanine N-acetyltransferase [Candidatus Syntrophonatronum acetioxidans]|uniref:[Ribosomal protein bS18]-alanine N-acetyltransferase n=1 Tax=Candidatus Syntrophonatronum acetioxidans TaxID=1795816 RepID=A0A424YA98_9FIRM|nr:MAG: ribosomal-protein-alanine N-acetyltransferase [Candidatus Syntrophonatronum acetioxidans]